MDTPFQGLVETAVGPTFVKTIGQGPPMVVVHGGPGFDHAYLIEPLVFLARVRTLIFYDQPGCGSTPAPAEGTSAAATFHHFRALVAALELGPLGVIAHSWGALVAVAAMAEAGGERRFREAIFVNPTPIKSAEYLEARTDFAQSLPVEAIAEIQTMIPAGKPGADIFAVVLPYYFGKPVAPLPRIEVTTMTYLTVDASFAALGAVDFTKGLDAFPGFDIIRGEKDFVRAELIADLTARARRTETLPGIGHFPSFEAPREFEAAVTRLLDR